MNEVIFYFILTILNLVRFKIKFMLTAEPFTWTRKHLEF